MNSRTSDAPPYLIRGRCEEPLRTGKIVSRSGAGARRGGLGMIAGMPALHAQVREVPQRVVEPVRKIGRTDHQRQLDDLPFVVILAQLLERAAADGRRAAGDALCVEDGGFLFLVKVRAALIELQRRDLLEKEKATILYAERVTRGAAAIRGGSLE